MAVAPANTARSRLDPRSASVREPVTIPAAGRVVRMSTTSATIVINAAAIPKIERMKIARNLNGSRGAGYSARSASSKTAGVSAVSSTHRDRERNRVGFR